MKVLVAIDSSQFSAQVLSAVAKRLWPPDCEFRILTLVEHCPDWDAENQFLHQSGLILDDRVGELKKRLPHHTIIGETMSGSASSAINEVAAKWGANLIVLGSHGDTGIRKDQIGSVAAAVANQSPCSVELIKVRRVARSNGTNDAQAAVLSSTK